MRDLVAYPVTRDEVSTALAKALSLLTSEAVGDINPVIVASLKEAVDTDDRFAHSVLSLLRVE